MSSKSKKSKIHVKRGLAYIKSTFNNTIVSICDQQGNVLGWCSTGMVGFKNSKKSTPFAAQLAAEKVCTQLIDSVGLEELDVIIKGPGSGRETAIRAFQSCGVNVLSIQDKTALPHNGCRPKKRRRV